MSRRQDNKQKWKKLYVEPNDDEFKFASPDMVGKCNKKLVFLGDLKESEADNDRIYCQGLNTSKNFINHPYFLGSGDHINSVGILTYYVR